MTPRSASGLIRPQGSTAAGGRPVPVLELENVSKEYGGSPPMRALDQVSLAVDTGELAAIVGTLAA